MRAILATLFVLAPIAAPAQRVELPIRRVVLSDGAARFSVMLTIDGQPVEAGLDTGSTGLRVLPRALGADARAAKGGHVTYSYGSGTEFNGDGLRVPVSAGALSGTIKLMRIDKIGCRDDRKDCPAAHAAPASFGIEGDGLAGEGFPAILGIRVKDDPVANPFEQLGVHRWIIDLPRVGEEQGRVILNPSDDEIANFQRIEVGPDGSMGGCLYKGDGTQKLCARAILDTGAPGLRVFDAKGFKPWPNGTPAGIAIGDGRAAATMDLTIGRRDQASALLIEPPLARPDTQLSFGLAPYYHWSVLYDADRHQIGLGPR